MKDVVPVRTAAGQKGPFWLHNSKGSHRVHTIHRVNCRLYHVLCEDGKWFALDPKHPLWRSS